MSKAEGHLSEFGVILFTIIIIAAALIIAAVTISNI
jgi:hypothetical protein